MVHIESWCNEDVLLKESCSLLPYISITRYDCKFVLSISILLSVAPKKRRKWYITKLATINIARWFGHILWAFKITRWKRDSNRWVFKRNHLILVRGIIEVVIHQWPGVLVRVNENVRQSGQKEEEWRQEYQREQAHSSSLQYQSVLEHYNLEVLPVYVTAARLRPAAWLF